MTEEAVARLARLDPEYVAVACDALLSRLVRVHQAVDASPGNAALLRKAQAAHIENAEALLNFLAVLCDAGGEERARPIRSTLETLLARVGTQFPWP